MSMVKKKDEIISYKIKQNRLLLNINRITYGLNIFHPLLQQILHEVDLDDNQKNYHVEILIHHQ